MNWSPVVGQVYGVSESGFVEYRYVGLTTGTLARRKSQHYKAAAAGRRGPFADWLRKHPDQESVYFQSLELVMADSLEALGEAERAWIARLGDEGHRLLNLNEGGLGNHGYVWSESQRAAASERMRGSKRPNYPRGPDHGLWGTSRSEELRARWSQQRKGMNSGSSNPNFGKFGPAHPSFGHMVCEETRALLSEQKRGSNNPNFGRTMSDEDRKRRSDTLRGRPMPSSVRSAHTRHHTNKGVLKDTCTHCQDDLRALADSGKAE